MAVRSVPRKTASCGVAAVAMVACVLAQWPVEADQDAATPTAIVRPCRIHGTVQSGEFALPGATVTARDGDRVVAVSSTDLDGMYVLAVASGTYTVRVELSAFASDEHEVTAGSPPCEATWDARMLLASRVPGYVAPAPVVASAAPAIAQGRDQGAGGGRGGGRGGRGGPGGRGGGPNRFQALTVQQSASGDAAVAEAATSQSVVTTIAADDPAARLLPAGFSTDALEESVTVNGTAVEVDRNQLADRVQALARGDFGLADGQQFGPAGASGATPISFGDAFGAGGQVGGFGGGGGRGGGFAAAGGRGVGAGATQINATYGLGGSMFESEPFKLRETDQTQKPQYLQQNFSTTIGGTVKIPHVYNGTNRTTYNFSYTGSRNDNLFDQYATVPSAAYRRGDFSASTTPIIDPQTGKAFPNNQIPVSRMSEASLALLNFIPTQNLDGDTRNFHVSDTTLSSSNQFSVRITHSFTQPQAGRGGRGGPGGFGGGRGGAAAGGGAAQGGRAGAQTAGGAAAPTSTSTTGATTPGTAAGTAGAATSGAGAGTTQAAGQAPAGRGQAPAGGRGQGGAGGRGGRGTFQPPLNVTMNATINYRRNDGARNNVFPDLSGANSGSTFSLPVTVNIRAGRSVHAIGGTFSRTASNTINQYGFRKDIAGLAGIQGVSTDPFDWGVPAISFSSGLTAIRDIAPSLRRDGSLQLNYTLTRPKGTHTYRLGGSYQQQSSRTRSDSNARGTFTFSGLYTANGFSTVRGSGQDFADFLLGLPQQATRQYSVNTDNIAQTVSIIGRQFSAFLQDDWRWKARWTINYGVQYDFSAPTQETNGHMVNLDANADFTAVATVQPGQVGPYSGKYPSGLVSPDWNNVAPKVGAAWRATNRSVVRFGYGLSYNSGTYTAIARNLYQQPPFFQTGTSVGTLAAPLALTNAFANISTSTITNNYGIDKNYVLGLIHQYTADYGHDLFRTWSVGATYIGTSGQHLDMLRAPNRGPNGLRIPGVQAFTWQSSEGSSYMNGVSFRLQKRQSHGISGTASYTLSKARDNTTATSGSAGVAQDDQNLDAEWARSNFDRRHQFNGSATIELPFGRNRHWLNTGGFVAAIADGWAMTASLSWQSGTPLTARCSSCSANLAQGVSGTLRADATGQPIPLDNPTKDEFFNINAFAIPAPGTFGSSGRNVITGPGSHLLNATFIRDVPLGANRTMSINVTASNLLNTMNFAGINTDVNSSQFGQVTSVNGSRAMRINLRFRF